MANEYQYPLTFNFRQEGGKQKVFFSLKCEEGDVDLVTEATWIHIETGETGTTIIDGEPAITGYFVITADSGTEKRTAILDFIVNDGDTCSETGKYIQITQDGPEHVCVCDDLTIVGKTDIQYSAGENILIGTYSSFNNCVTVVNVTASSTDNWLTITSFNNGEIRGTITRNESVQYTRNASLSITGQTSNGSTCDDYDLVTVTQNKKDVTCTCENNFKVHQYTVDSDGGNGITLGYVENINSCITGIMAYKTNSTDTWINRVGMNGTTITGDVESYDVVTDNPRGTSISVSGVSENGNCVSAITISQNGKGYTCDECKDFALYDQMTDPISSDGILSSFVIANFSYSDDACKNWSGTLFETDKNGNAKQGGYTSSLSISTIDSTHRSIKVSNGIPANQDRNAKYYSFNVYDGETQCTTGSGVRLIVQEGDIRCECEDLIDKDGSMVRTLNKTFNRDAHSNVNFASGNTAGCGRLEIYVGEGDPDMITNLGVYHPDGDDEKYIWTGNVTTADEQRSVTLKFYYYDVAGNLNECSEGIIIRQLPYVCDCPSFSPYLTAKTDIPGDAQTKRELWDFAFEPGGADDNLCAFVVAEAVNILGNPIEGYTAYTKYNSSQGRIHVSLDAWREPRGIQHVFKVKLYVIVNCSIGIESDTWYDSTFFNGAEYDTCEDTVVYGDCMQQAHTACDCYTYDLKVNKLTSIGVEDILVVSDSATIPNDTEQYKFDYTIRCGDMKATEIEIYCGSTRVSSSVAEGRNPIGGNAIWFSANAGDTRVFTVKIPVYIDGTKCSTMKTLTITQKGCDCETFIDGDIFTNTKYIGADETTVTATAYLNCLPTNMTFTYKIYQYDRNASCSDTGCECFNDKCYKEYSPAWYHGGSITPDTSGQFPKLVLTLNVDANDGQYTEEDGTRSFFVGIFATMSGEEEPCYKSISEFKQRPTCNVCSTMIGVIYCKDGGYFYKKTYPTAGVTNDAFAYAYTLTCLSLDDYEYETVVTIYDEATEEWVVDSSCSMHVDYTKTKPEFVATVPANREDYIIERRVYFYIKDKSTGQRVSVDGKECSTYLSMYQSTAADCSCNSYGATRVRVTEADGLSKDSEGYILTRYASHHTNGLVIGTCNMNIINTDCLRYVVHNEHSEDLRITIDSDGTITVYPEHYNEHGSQGEPYSADINIYNGDEYCSDISGYLLKIKLIS